MILQLSCDNRVSICASTQGQLIDNPLVLLEVTEDTVWKPRLETCLKNVDIYTLGFLSSQRSLSGFVSCCSCHTTELNQCDGTLWMGKVELRIKAAREKQFFTPELLVYSH